MLRGSLLLQGNASSSMHVPSWCAGCQVWPQCPTLLLGNYGLKVHSGTSTFKGVTTRELIITVIYCYICIGPFFYLKSSQDDGRQAVYIYTPKNKNSINLLCVCVCFRGLQTIKQFLQWKKKCYSKNILGDNGLTREFLDGCNVYNNLRMCFPAWGWA